MSRQHIAVYGTLMEGYGNNRILSDCKKLGTLRIQGYKMVNLGAFPGVVCTGDPDHTVKAEVWEVDEDAIARMDRLEGHPNFYMRQRVLNLQGHDLFDAALSNDNLWMYVLPSSALESSYHRGFVNHGDWTLWLEGRRNV